MFIPCLAPLARNMPPAPLGWTVCTARSHGLPYYRKLRAVEEGVGSSLLHWGFHIYAVCVAAPSILFRLHSPTFFVCPHLQTRLPFSHHPLHRCIGSPVPFNKELRRSTFDNARTGTVVPSFGEYGYIYLPHPRYP